MQPIREGMLRLWKLSFRDIAEFTRSIRNFQCNLPVNQSHELDGGIRPREGSGFRFVKFRKYQDIQRTATFAAKSEWHHSLIFINGFK